MVYTRDLIKAANVLRYGKAAWKASKTVLKGADKTTRTIGKVVGKAAKPITKKLKIKTNLTKKTHQRAIGYGTTATPAGASGAAEFKMKKNAAARKSVGKVVARMVMPYIAAGGIGVGATVAHKKDKQKARKKSFRRGFHYGTRSGQKQMYKYLNRNG